MSNWHIAPEAVKAPLREPYPLGRHCDLTNIAEGHAERTSHIFLGD
jgi:hypothetical protein